MRKYDGVFLFDSSLEDPVLEEKIRKIQETIQENGGEVLEMNRWGRMPLAYPVKKQKNGYYFITRFSGNPVVLQKLAEAFKYEESLLRHLITKSEGGSLQREPLSERGDR